MVLMAASRCPLAAATLCALLLVVGCVGSENSGPALSSEPGPAVPQTVLVEAEPGAGTFVQPKDADRSDVESTAEVAALLLHSWDTLTDRTQTAAAVRARPLMIEEWAANQIEPERNGAHGDWLEPGQHRAFSSPSIVPVTGDVNRDVAADKVIRAYEVSWRWISHEGRDLGITGRQLVTLYREQHDGLWDVVGHHFHELGTIFTNWAPIASTRAGIQAHRPSARRKKRTATYFNEVPWTVPGRPQDEGTHLTEVEGILQTSGSGRSISIP